jgi:DNA-binding response OmpR family regulator
VAAIIHGVISQVSPSSGRFSRVAPVSPTAPKVLLISGDDLIRRPVLRAYEREGMQAVAAPSGRDGLRTLFHERPEIVVLDLAVTEPCAWEVLERVRQLCNAPVIALGRTGAESEVVKALRSGADAYVRRPLSALELIAYTVSLHHRSDPTVEREQNTHYDDGFVEVDPSAAEARAAGRPLNLTPLEMRLLTELTAHSNQTLSHAQLLSRVWGDDVHDRERVKMLIGYLRAKFKAAGVEAPIVTQRGFGYRYVVPRG